MAIQTADDAAMQAYMAQSPGLQESRGKLYVRFYMDAIQNEEKSAAEGRPVFDDHEFIEIMVPGDKDNRVARPVRKSDTILYAAQYAAFKQNREAPVEGTPLSVLPFLTKAQVLEFESQGIKTAEQVRDMADAVAQKFMGVNNIRKRVVNFLEAAAGNAQATKLQSELDKRDNTIQTLQRALEEQGRKIEELMKSAAPTVKR